MLDNYIIEELRRREERERRREEQPTMELPVEEHVPRPRRKDEEKPKSEDSVDRGVVIIDI